MLLLPPVSRWKGGRLFDLAANDDCVVAVAARVVDRVDHIEECAIPGE